MFRLVNHKYALTKTFISILLTGSLVGLLGTQKAIAEPNGDVMGLELYYQNSAFQCGLDSTQADIKVKVYDTNNNLLTTMSKGDRYTSNEIDSVSDLSFVYEVYNLSCFTDGTSVAAEDTMLLGANDTIPNIEGFSGQASITEMLVGLNSYEELYLVELGNSDTTNIAYDLQDLVVVVDNNPSSIISAD